MTWPSRFVTLGVAVSSSIVVMGLVVGAVPGQARRNARRPQRATAPHDAVGPIYNVAPNLYVVPGGGGNTAVFVTSIGVVLVDTKYEDRHQALVDQVRTVTDKPITHAINTHAHADHTGGNALLDPNVEIIMHERTASPVKGQPTPSSPRSPRIRTVRDTLTLFSGEDQIDLHNFGPAHTGGDLFVVFRSAGVMHAGDVFSGKGFPIINLEGDGNGVTFPLAVDRAASLTGIRRVITGHSSVLPWQDLLAFRDFNLLLFEYVHEGITSGRDKNEVFQSFKLPAQFADYRTGRAFATMDEIDRSIRPRWLRMLPPVVSRYWYSGQILNTGAH